jgi:hypothetical protein
MNILITYDIDKRHPEVKSALIKAGFSDTWIKNQTKYYLPNTTLWSISFSTLKLANDIFNKTIEDLNIGKTKDSSIHVKHFMSIQFTDSLGITGEPHA